MPVYRYCTIPGPRRARVRVRATFDADTKPGAPEETEALQEVFARITAPLLDGIERDAKEYMANRRLPVAVGEFWCSEDGSRWVPATADMDHPKWAPVLVGGHPAQRSREGSPDRDACDMLLRCDLVRLLMGGSASAAELVQQAIGLGMVAERVRFEARFGLAADEGIKRLRIDQKAARTSGNWELQERSRRWCDEVNEALAGGRRQAEVYREIADRERVPESTVAGAVWRERNRRRKRV